MGKNVESISMFAFAECLKLTHICLPLGFKELKKFTFANCDNLGNIKLPDNIQFIDQFSVIQCPKLKHIYFFNRSGEITGKLNEKILKKMKQGKFAYNLFRNEENKLELEGYCNQKFFKKDVIK